VTSEGLHLNIITVTDDFPPRIGGMATHAWELSKALARLGHRVSVVTAAHYRMSKSRLKFPRTEEKDGVVVARLGVVGFRREWQLLRGLIGRIEAFAEGWSDETVIHAHELFACTRIRPLTQLPLVWTNHSSVFLGGLGDHNIRYDLRKDIALADFITAPSRELVEKTLELGVAPSRCRYIPNGVDLGLLSADRGCSPGTRTWHGTSETIRIPPEKCAIVCARRFAAKNGIHVFLDALGRLPSDVAERCVVLFAGNITRRNAAVSEYERDMLKRISKISPGIECHLLGSVPNAAMPTLYACADLCVLPSFQEATSITGLEAMAASLPIVGSTAGGIPEIVEHGKTGLLSEPGDSQKMGQHLQQLILSRDRRLMMGAAARKKAELEFSWAAIAARFVDVYESVLADE